MYRLTDLVEEDRKCGLVLSFFFQAEDGIRDDLVTGVQTCALPISSIMVDGMVSPNVHMFIASNEIILVKLPQLK